MGLLQKTEAVSCVQDENKSVLNKNQETSKQYEQKIAMYVTPVIVGSSCKYGFAFPFP